VSAQQGSHSSIRSACEVKDAEFVGVLGDAHQWLGGDDLRAVLEAEGPETFFAVVATAVTTNFGIVDGLDSVARVCHEYGVWFHVTASTAGRVWPRRRFVTCSLAMIKPTPSSSTRTSGSSRLMTAVLCSTASLLWDGQPMLRTRRTWMRSWNPTECEIGLTRRGRGLPLWFSLATPGTTAYTAAIERTLEVARFAEDEIARRLYLEAVLRPLCPSWSFAGSSGGPRSITPGALRC